MNEPQSTPSEPDCIQVALKLIQNGEIDTALDALREIMRIYPHSHAAYTCMGMLATQAGKLNDAISLLKTATGLGPGSSEAFMLLACAHRENEDLGEAEKACREALEIRPDYPEALSELCAVLYMNGRIDESVAAGRRSVAKNANSAKALNNLGMALIKNYSLEEAELVLGQSLVLDPENYQTWRSRGRARLALEDNSGALVDLEESLRLTPDNIDTIHDIFLAQVRLDSFDAARKTMDHLLDASPHRTATLTDLLSLRSFNDTDLYYRRAMKLDPSDMLPQLCRAHLLLIHGHCSEAITEFKALIKRFPSASSPRAGHLMATQYISGDSPLENAKRHWEWGSTLDSGKLNGRQLPPTDSNQDRKLRIGYLSADLRRHSVAYFIKPILANADATRVENICYFDCTMPDRTTIELNSLAHGWRDVGKKSDEELRMLIEKDEIDILVDLSGYSGKRIQVLADRAAPIQMSYCGYPNTTGLRNMDYRIVDSITDPKGSEELCREE